MQRSETFYFNVKPLGPTTPKLGHGGTMPNQKVNGNNTNSDKGKLLSQIAYEKIKEAIIENDFAPGQEVTESQLAERFNIGKAPVRFALANLIQEGLVSSQSRRGYVIAPLTMKDIHEVWGIRKLLEMEAAKLAAGKVDINRLKDLDRICKKGFRVDDILTQRAYLSANKEFHLTICKATENLRMVTLVEQLIDHMTRMFLLGIVMSNTEKHFTEGHKPLIDALEQGDGNRASECVREHLNSGLDSVLNAVMKSPTLLQINLVAEP